MNPNREDQELLDSYESGEWRPVDSLQREIKRYQEYAAAWLEENSLISLALPAKDFGKLQKKANEAGIPYQALIARLIHQYVSGDMQAKP